jgi:hypothetical protein
MKLEARIEVVPAERGLSALLREMFWGLGYVRRALKAGDLSYAPGAGVLWWLKWSLWDTPYAGVWLWWHGK